MYPYYPPPCYPRGSSPCVPNRAGTLYLGNVLRVDAVYGNDATARVGGAPYKTVNAAIAAASSGQTLWILPGTYTLTAGITIPAGVSIRGLSTQTVTLQMLNVTTDTTLVTMGENTRLEDCTLLLTSSGHYTLVGIAFAGTTTVTAKLRTCVVSVNNATASTAGSSNVYGVLCSGTGTLGASTFSFNCLKGSTINVYSNGGGTKRGIVVTNTNIATTRDLNVYVAQPTNVASTGSYVGAETNDPANNQGSIQTRSTTVGVVKPTAGQLYTASDILQTTPPTVSSPTYLASPGIQIGPGTDLVTKSAGGKAFSTYVYPTTVFYGLKGNLTSAGAGYMWPGTQAVSAGTFPDPGIPPAYYRIQQPSILSGMYASLNTAPGSTNTTTVTVYRTPVGGSLTATVFTVTFTGTDTVKGYYNSSLDLAAGDTISVKVSYTGGSNASHDLTCQLDLF